jgi:hypothetical protein
VPRDAVEAELFRPQYKLYQKHIEALDQATELAKHVDANNAEFMDFNVFTKLIATDLRLDRETFWDIYNMIQGGDREARDIAVEMMTNVNIDNSTFLIDVLCISCWEDIKKSNVYNKVTFAPIRHHIDNIYGGISTSFDLRSSKHATQMMLQRISVKYKYHDMLHKLRLDLIRELLYPFVEAQVTQAIDVIGVKVKHVTFDLDPEIFPDTKKYFKPAPLPQNLPEEDELAEYITDEVI